MKKILDFGNKSYSDVSGKYQNMEKPLKHQRRLGLAVAQPRVSRKKSSMLTPKVAKLIFLHKDYFEHSVIQNHY